jgi:selenocysteine lyase/cysteine desulfurase
LSSPDPFTLLENGVFAALETYSNVHRGSGQKSILSTQLFEQARKIILSHSKKSSRTHTVIFSTPGGADLLSAQCSPKDLTILSSSELGLPLGVRALVVRRRSLPKGTPARSGGGTTKLISREWIIWAKAPARFEPGTPPVINIITFARALQIAAKYGRDCFRRSGVPGRGANEILYRDEFSEFRGPELLEKLRETRIGGRLMVPTHAGSVPAVNLDSSASTPAFAPVWEAYRKTLRESLEVRDAMVDEVKSICASFVGASLSEYEVIFTSNTTESINLVAEHVNAGSGVNLEPVLVSSLLEHSSNDLPWRSIPRSRIIRLSVDKDGFFDLAALEGLLREYNVEKKHGNKRIGMVALSGASNVLGTCNYLTTIGQTVRSYGVRFLVDGAQLIAHRKIDMEASGIDFLAFSAHKAYAPFGCGVLVARKDSAWTGPDQADLASGSEENVAGIAALGKSLSLLGRIGMDTIEHEEQEITVHAVKRLSGVKDLQIYGISDPESPEFARRLGVISFNLKNTVSFRIGKELALRKGIGIRVGCHCAHITVKHILNVGPGLERFQRIMQTLIPVMSFPGVARASVGIENSRDDLDRLVEGLGEISRKKEQTGKQGTNERNPDADVVSRTELREQLKAFYTARAEKVYGAI